MKIGLPMFSRSTTPRTARGRIHESAFNVDIRVGDVNVSAGDFVIADATGVVFVPAAIATKVLDLAEQIAAKEKLMAEDIAAGRPVTDVMDKDYETLLGTQD